MVEYNIGNNTIIKSYSLLLASIALGDTDFTLLKVTTSCLLGVLWHSRVILTLPHGDKIEWFVQFYTGGTQPEQEPAVAVLLHLWYWLSLRPQASAMNTFVLRAWFRHTTTRTCSSIFSLNCKPEILQALALWPSKCWRQVIRTMTFPQELTKGQSFPLDFHHSITCLNYSSKICLTLVIDLQLKWK